MRSDFKKGMSSSSESHIDTAKLNEIKQQIKKDKILRTTQKLYQDYRSICNSFGIQLRTPLILISSLHTSLGDWDPILRRIRISENLIETRPWYDVINILKHEMAHQIVSDIFLKDDGHGTNFKAACKMLGLDQEFQKARIDINEKFPNWNQEENDTEENQLLRKIERLLSLANSSNENESCIAMEKVQELYLKYNITSIENKKKSKYVTLVIPTKKTRSDHIQSLITSILVEFYFVECIYGFDYNYEDEKTYQIISILGEKQNVLMAEFVYHFLTNKVNELWSHYKKVNNTAVKYKRSYQIGILNGFSQKLKSNEKKVINNDKNSQEIMVLQRAYLDDFKNEKFPKLKTKSYNNGKVYGKFFNEGVEEGSKVIINKPLEEKKSSVPLLK